MAQTGAVVAHQAPVGAAASHGEMDEPEPVDVDAFGVDMQLKTGRCPYPQTVPMGDSTLDVKTWP